MSKNEKIILGIVVIIIAIAGVWYEINKKPAEKEAIKIGVVEPLSGSRADAGEYVKNALLLAEEDINNDSRRKYKISFIYEDSKYEPQTAVGAITKLRNLDKVHYVIGAQGSSETLAIAPIAETSKIILITPGSQSDEISKAGDYIFRTIHNTAQEAPIFAETVARRMKSDTIHFLALNTDATPSYLKHFQPAIEQKGKRVGIVEKFDPKETDFRTQLLKIKAENPADIFLIATPKNAGMILKQSGELDIKAQFYNIGVEGPELIQIAGGAAEGLVYPYSYDIQSESAYVKNFHQKYLDRYKRENDTVAANAYDAAYLLSNCFEKVGDNVEKVKNCLYQTTNYEGASGKFSIDQNGDAVKQFIIKTIKNGQFVKYEE